MKKIIFLIFLFVVAISFSTSYAEDPTTFTPLGMNQKQLVNHLYEVQQALLNRNMNPAGLAMGGTAAHMKTVNTCEVVLNGIFYECAVNSDIELSSTVQAADTTCYYLICYKPSTADFNVTKGKDGDTNLYNIATPALSVPIGYVKVVTVAVTFTMDTDDFNASGVTSTFYDISHKPFKYNASITNN